MEDPRGEKKDPVGKQRRAGAEEEEERFGCEAFPDEAQLTARTYSTLMTGLTTSTR